MTDKVDTKKSPTPKPEATVDEGRRTFLRQSVYAAYATPVIVSLLVEQASAAQSKPPDHPACGRPNPPPWCP